MRVALVSPNGDARDAALFIELARANCELKVIVPRQQISGSWPSEVDMEPLDTRGSNWTRQWMKGLNMAIESYNPDLVHVHNEPWAVTTQRLRRGRRPVVIHGAENVLATAPLGYRIRRAGLSRPLKDAAGYVNWGHTGLDAALSSGLPSGTPRAVIPASPPDPTAFPRVPLREPDRELRVAFVGRLVELKGVDDLLRGIGFTRNPRRITLDVVGSGPEAESLRDLAARLGVRARFYGPLDAQGVHQILADSDVLVAPSRDTPLGIEQWGRSVVEAMMTGRSVLVSDSGEPPHLVDNAEWVFQQNDPESIGRALDVLLSNPGLLRTRAEEAFVRAQAFRPQVLAHQMLDFWDEVLDHWRARRTMDGRLRLNPFR